MDSTAKKEVALQIGLPALTGIIKSFLERQLSMNLQSQLEALDRKSPERTSQLRRYDPGRGCAAGASDVHFEPTHHALEIRFRLDGVLQPVARA